LAVTNALDHSRQPSDLEWSERRNGPRTEYVVAPARLDALPLLVFAGIWDSFIVFFIMALVRSPRAPGPMLLFPLAHVMVGVYLTWMALVKTLNRSHFTIDPDTFVLVQRPIWQRGARCTTRDIDGFDTLESRGNRGSTRWRIRVLTRDGKATKLALPLDSLEHLGFIAAKLNAALAEAREPVGYRELA
jgi:hypothetical protein